MAMITMIKKRDGRQVAFNIEKIAGAIFKAAQVVGGNDYNEAMMGKVLDILVDGYDEESEQYFGRSYADSPDIDGRVWIASDEPIREGTFVKVCIDGCLEGDLSGYIVEE